MDETKLSEAEEYIRGWLKAQGAARGGDLEVSVMEAYNLTRMEARALCDPLVAAYKAAVLEAPIPPPAPPAAPPAPVRRAKAPAVAPKRRSGLELLQHLGDMAAKLEAHALKPDQDSPDGTTIQFPVMYTAAHGMFVRSIEMEIEIGTTLMGMERVKELLAAIAETLHRHLSAADPDLRDMITADVEAAMARFNRPAA